MNETLHHPLGVVSVVEGEVVLSFAGTRRTGLLLRKTEWSNEIRFPLATARASFHDGRLALYDAGRPVQSVVPSDLPETVHAFVEVLGEMEVAAPVASNQRVQVKVYKNAKAYQKDAPNMAGKGWLPEGQIQAAQRVAVGRTVGKVVLTGGVGLLLSGRSKKGEEITVTYVRR